MNPWLGHLFSHASHVNTDFTSWLHILLTHSACHVFCLPRQTWQDIHIEASNTIIFVTQHLSSNKHMLYIIKSKNVPLYNICINQFGLGFWTGWCQMWLHLSHQSLYVCRCHIHVFTIKHVWSPHSTCVFTTKYEGPYHNH